MNRKRRWCAFLIITILVMFYGQGVMAIPSSSQIQDQKEEVQSQLNQNQAELDNLNSEIGELSGEKEALEGEIAAINDDLVSIMASISILEEEIAQKEAEIEQAKLDLAAAIETENEQYEAMKVRIRFMYEKGDYAYVALLAEAQSLSDMLTKAEYISKLYDYDRKLLTEYQETKEAVAQMKINLENEESELVTTKEECKLEQAELEVALNEMQAVASDYASQIASAKKEAANYATQIKQQNAQIKKLEEQRQAALAQEEAARLAALAAANGGTTSQSTTSNANRYTGSAYTVDTSIISNANGSDTGKQIALFAVKYLGNPYVAGGTSLTNGADCSGFTSTVYSSFGISIPRSSYGQRSAGTEVAYADAQPGDIICYSGHVALYIGGGLIVHASSSKTGIKISNATYRTILTVRRIV